MLEQDEWDVGDEVARAIEEATTFYEELEVSPPRAQLSLAVSRIEEWLSEEMLQRLAKLQGTQRFEDLDANDKRVLRGMVPRSTSGKIGFGYALGILPYRTLGDLKRALKLRNRVVHRTAPLTQADKRAIKKGVSYLREMEFYIAQVTSYLPHDGPLRPAPEFPK